MKKPTKLGAAIVVTVALWGIASYAITGSPPSTTGSAVLAPPYIGAVFEGQTGNVQAKWHDAAGNPAVIDEVVSWQFKVGNTLLYSGGPLTSITSDITLLTMPSRANRIVNDDLTSERRKFSAIGRIGSEYIPLVGTYDVINDPNMKVNVNTGALEYYNP